MKPRQPPPTNPDYQCSCEEVFINGRRIPRPRWHDCTYIYKRNARLPKVCVTADAAVDGMPDSTPEERSIKLNARAAVISREMDLIGHRIVAEMDNPNLTT